MREQLRSHVIRSQWTSAVQPNLPPGQFAIDRLPRFGLTKFTYRFPRIVDRIVLSIVGEVECANDIGPGLARLPRVEQISDFHCVTTWSCRNLSWSGWRFRDVFDAIILTQAKPSDGASFIVMHGQDGARSSLPLEDLVADDVLLADRLDGAPLSIGNGAPLRLVAPAHYGYKSVKHIDRIAFHFDDRNYRPSAFRFMDHPRARVALEERGLSVPGLFLRYPYRLFVRPTIRRNERAMHERNGR